MNTRQAIIHKRPTAWVAAFTTLSWIGEFIHNRFELPQLTVLSPENSLPLLVSAALFVLWWSLPGTRWPAALLLAWALLHLIGGAVLSVIPFRFLPFYPEQSLSHYLSHGLYGLAQLPLILMMLQHVRRHAYPAHSV